LGLSDPRQIYTAAEMDAVHTESRAEMRGMVSAVISDCRSRWDRSYVPTPLEKAMAKWPAAFAALDAAKQVQVAGRDNVISLAQQIADAGRKRRGESS
jgi:hypothetical protein